jgi:hypothetical protein
MPPSLGQKSTLQRKCSIQIWGQEEETQLHEQVQERQLDQETAEPQESEKKLMLNRSNVTQFNNLNLSLITILYC